MMKPFHTTREIFYSLSINPEEVSEQNRCNLKRLTIFFLVTQCIIPLWLFFLFEAKNFNEYADSFYSVATSTHLFFTYFIIYSKRHSVFRLMRDFESVMQERKFSIFVEEIRLKFYNIYRNKKTGIGCNLCRNN